MRREAGRVSHWHTGSTQATLQRAAEIARTEKAGATSFGIPDAQPLNRRRVLFGLATTGHAEQLTWRVTRVLERQARQPQPPGRRAADSSATATRAEQPLRPCKQRPVVDWSACKGSDLCNERSLEVEPLVLGTFVRLPGDLRLGEAQNRRDPTAGSVPVLGTMTADLDQHHVGIIGTLW